MDVVNWIDSVGDRTTMFENSNGRCGIYKCKRLAPAISWWNRFKSVEIAFSYVYINYLIVYVTL